MPALSVLGASWRLKPEERSLLIGTYIPWALHAGSRSADLMCLYYERHFEVRYFNCQQRLLQMSSTWSCCVLKAGQLTARQLLNGAAVSFDR